MRAELQADRLAGAWAANAPAGVIGLRLTRSDIAQALDGAAAVGDDRIQERVQGRAIPERWTYGSGEQRQRWFVNGLRAGGPGVCDTFRGSV